MENAPAVEPPELFEADGLMWARTDISKGGDLINGKAWIQAFQDRCASMAATATAPSVGRRRLLRQVASTGDEPQYWARSGDLANSDRNRVLEHMAAEGCPRPGRRVLLPNGGEVIFWFNVGATADFGPPAERVFVTAARCPHQGVCLTDGELKEIEDLAGTKKAVIRCPRHNRLFDVTTGLGEGSPDTLQTFPARFVHEHRRFYVAVGPARAATLPNAEVSCSPQGNKRDDMDVDGEEHPSKRPRAIIPTPARTLFRHGSLT